MVSWGELFDLENNSDSHEVKRNFYNTIYFPFGLPSTTGQNFKYPISMRVKSGTVQSFEIAGQQLAVSMFLSKSWSNIFNRIQREVPVRNGHAYAFNISELHLGKLSGYQEPFGSPELILSNERIEVLDVIGSTVAGRLTTPPLVYIEMGETWYHFGIPDNIYVQFFTMGPMQGYNVKSFTQAIYHRYNVLAHEQGLDISCTFDNKASVFNFKASPKRVTAPPQPVYQPQTQPSQPAEPEDSFPYDYYESIGLIDNEGMVTVDTILGPVKTLARSEHGRIHLLEAGKKI